MSIVAAAVAIVKGATNALAASCGAWWSRILIAWGSHAHLERYITPQRGLGYWLGITGGSMMLLLLIYSARKRFAWLRWIGGIPAWFEIHMMLGVVGPLLVLFHANFSLGATNSNVALICMLVVAGSGVVGRYIYTRLHAHLDGHEDTLEQLKAVGERLRSQTTSISFLPGLLDAHRARGASAGSRRRRDSCGAFCTCSPADPAERWRAGWCIAKSSMPWRKPRQQESALIARHAQRIAKVARRYADRRLEAGRRIAEYQMYARLFSFWHVLHIPLFFMLLIAGIVHVVAINVY